MGISDISIIREERVRLVLVKKREAYTIYLRYVSIVLFNFKISLHFIEIYENQ